MVWRFLFISRNISKPKTTSFTKAKTLILLKPVLTLNSRDYLWVSSNWINTTIQHWDIVFPTKTNSLTSCYTSPRDLSTTWLQTDVTTDPRDFKLTWLQTHQSRWWRHWPPRCRPLASTKTRQWRSVKAWTQYTRQWRRRSVHNVCLHLLATHCVT